MPLDNLAYFYEHLPSRFRREDKDLFLKRFLQFFGETLNDYDDLFDNFAANINPATADERWIEFWLDALFGWNWFPKWFRLAEKRTLYANFARHLARRGTARGIELLLADFRLTVKVHNRPAFYGEWAWGESFVAVAEPLLIVVEIISAAPVSAPEMTTDGESVWGESPYTTYEPLFTQREVNALFAYQQPQAQEILLIPLQEPTKIIIYSGAIKKMSKKKIVEIVETSGISYGQISHPNDIVLAQNYAHQHAENLTKDFLQSNNAEVAECGFGYNAMDFAVTDGRIYLSGKQYDVSFTSNQLAAANGSYPRIDLVVATIADDVPTNTQFIAFQRLRTAAEIAANTQYPATQFQRASERQNLAAVSIKPERPPPIQSRPRSAQTRSLYAAFAFRPAARQSRRAG